MLSLSKNILFETFGSSSKVLRTVYSQLLLCQNAKSTCLPIVSNLNGQRGKHTSIQNTQKRCYSAGEYSKLWSAATGGRGVGRGRKKKRTIPVGEEFSKFGKEKKFWPGFTSPIDLTSPNQADPDVTSAAGDRTKEGFSRPKQFEKGWSGHKWPGKSAGPPILANGEVLDEFHSIVVELKRVAVQKARGKKRQISAAVVIGNRNGVVGWAIGKGQVPVGAIRKARNKAANYLHDITISDNHTIYHDLSLKYDNIRLTMERKPKGHGLRCQRIVRAICDLAGIKDLRCKLIGGSTPQTIVNATIVALKSQETHKELAERTGKNVVEFRAEEGMRPVVVASPSPSAVRARIERESHVDPNSNIEAAFDPTRGLHRAKSISHGRGRHVQT